MASIYSPQSSAGIQSFYDAPSKGPKLNPKMVLGIIVVFTIVIMVADHFIFA